jgi:hypothetical protein
VKIYLSSIFNIPIPSKHRWDDDENMPAGSGYFETIN